jgi:hypothetical protein
VSSKQDLEAVNDLTEAEKTDAIMYLLAMEGATYVSGVKGALFTVGKEQLSPGFQSCQRSCPDFSLAHMSHD